MTKGRNHQERANGVKLSLIVIAALVVSSAIAADHESATHFYSDADALFDQGRFAEAAAA